MNPHVFFPLNIPCRSCNLRPRKTVKLNNFFIDEKWIGQSPLVSAGRLISLHLEPVFVFQMHFWKKLNFFLFFFCFKLFFLCFFKLFWYVDIKNKNKIFSCISKRKLFWKTTVIIIPNWLLAAGFGFYIILIILFAFMDFLLSMLLWLI